MRLQTRFLTTALALGLALGLYATAADKSEPLAGLAAHVLKEGKDAQLNTKFAGFLGIPTNSALPLKRIVEYTNKGARVIDVSVADRQTIVLTVREWTLSTFYVTDLSGSLKRAVVNDVAILDGGLTNLPISKAQAGFGAQKQEWLRKYGQ